jgi:hypothetical protein
MGVETGPTGRGVVAVGRNGCAVGGLTITAGRAMLCGFEVEVAGLPAGIFAGAKLGTAMRKGARGTFMTVLATLTGPGLAGVSLVGGLVGMHASVRSGFLRFSKQRRENWRFPYWFRKIIPLLCLLLTRLRDFPSCKICSHTKSPFKTKKPTLRSLTLIPMWGC